MIDPYREFVTALETGKRVEVKRELGYRFMVIYSFYVDSKLLLEARNTRMTPADASRILEAIESAGYEPQPQEDEDRRVWVREAAR